MPEINFAKTIRPLIGLPIGHAWKAYGSAIFLELGDLRPTGPNDRLTGEFCIAIEWDWRIELGATVLYGSSNTGAHINSRISEIEGAMIESIDTFGDIPELVIVLAAGHRIRTSVMAAGDPRWSIKLGEGDWLFVESGNLRRGEGIACLTPEEAAENQIERATAKRWSVPVAEPNNGRCSQCVSYVSLDGHSYLLDYGACIAANGPFDGKVVNAGSGCPEFQSIEVSD